MSEDPRIVHLRARGAHIGVHVFFGPDVYIEHDFAPLLTIEDGVVLARGVSILLHDSALNNILGEPIKFGTVILRQHCYIGANTTLVCGVEVGERALIGAGSLVTEDVPREMVAFGQPAHVRGNVYDLAEKHRQQRSDNNRFFYLDMIPWRQRHDAETEAQTAEQISAFLQSIVHREHI